MTTTNAAAMKTVGYPFTGKKEIVQVTYDFATDGGAVSTVNLMKMLDDVVVTDFHAVVKTTCTSGGSATVELGKTGTATQFVGATAGAVANLSAGAVLGVDTATNVPCKMSAGDYLIMTIGTAALTAGKIVVTLEIMKL